MHLLIFAILKKWQFIFSAMKPKKSVNQKSNSELTIEKLRTFKGFENFTDEQAEKIIANIKRLSNLLFGMYSNNNPSKLF